MNAYDVIVAGGGPAGVAAAIEAGRNGAQTLLIEKSPCLGGAWTSGSMNLCFDYHDKSGVMLEIRQRLEARNAWAPWNNWPGRQEEWPALFNIEEMKFLLEKMCHEAGVDILLQTSLMNASIKNRLINSVSTFSKSGIEEFTAKIFIDTTGDGDLSAQSGCGYETGREKDGKMQPATMFAVIGGWPDAIPHHNDIAEFFKSRNYYPSYKNVTLFQPAGFMNTAYLMATHLYGLDPADNKSITSGLTEGRRQIMEMFDLLKNSGDTRFKNLFLISTGPELAIREGRRIHGLHYLTLEELRSNTIFNDGVCPVSFNIDIHAVDPSEGTGLVTEKLKRYHIPYRCLVARDIDNLLLAGRLISGDFYAHASYRVTGDCAAMGSVTGKAAAFAVSNNLKVAEVPAAEIRLNSHECCAS